MCNHNMQFVYVGLKRFCASYWVLHVTKLFAFERWILLCTPAWREARCGAELPVLAGVKMEGLVHASQIYFVSPVANCLKLWQSSDTSDLRYVCQLSLQHIQCNFSAHVERLLVWGCICSRCYLRALWISSSIIRKKMVTYCQSTLNW